MKYAKSKRFEGIMFPLTEIINEKGNVLLIAAHSDLLSAVINLSSERKLKYDYDQIQVLGREHFLVKCIFQDEEYRIVEYGEVNPATLTSSIAREYPATMALNRAFDRAAIRYLNLEGKVYSDNELDVKNFKKAEEASPADTSSCGFEDVDSATDTINEPKLSPEPSLQTPGKSKDNKEKSSKLGQEKVGMLKHAQLTLQECLDKDKPHLIWIAQNVKSGGNLEKANQIRSFLQESGVSY